ncbi:hypothetical protein AOLI_G00246280 [Acnodon oligacanthus]
MPPNAFVMRGALRGGPGSQEREACDILGEMAGRSVPRLDLKSVLGSHKVRAGEQLRGAPSAGTGWRNVGKSCTDHLSPKLIIHALIFGLHCDQ